MCAGGVPVTHSTKTSGSARSTKRGAWSAVVTVWSMYLGRVPGTCRPTASSTRQAPINGTRWKACEMSAEKMAVRLPSVVVSRDRKRALHKAGQKRWTEKLDEIEIAPERSTSTMACQQLRVRRFKYQPPTTLTALTTPPGVRSRSGSWGGSSPKAEPSSSEVSRHEAGPTSTPGDDQITRWIFGRSWAAPSFEVLTTARW